jgi:DNA processing protein
MHRLGRNKEGRIVLDKKQVLTLMQIAGIGRRTVHKVLLSSASSSEPLDQSELLRHLTMNLPGRLRNKLPNQVELEHASDEAEKIMQTARELGIQVLSWGDDLLPSRFWKIPDPPILLYIKGNTECLTSGPVVTVVGTRHPTSHGLAGARRLGAAFAKLGCTVVSGLALGCDTAAHDGCLSANGKTVGVLAHGLDYVYPASNRELAERIVDNWGCILSEYPLGTKPRGRLFVERDRLQSGLGMGVVVVETSRKGGSMHTVDYAKRQKRKIACLLPPDVSRDDRHSGNLELINSGTASVLELTEHDLLQFVVSLDGASMNLFRTRRSKKGFKNQQQGIGEWF